MMEQKHADDEPEVVEESQEEAETPNGDKPEEAMPANESIATESKPVAPEKTLMEASSDDGLPKVALKVFIASGGIRWDQMAGFKSYATRLKMGPLSIPQWREAFNKFTKRPV